MKPCFKPPSRILDIEYKKMSYDQHMKALKTMKPIVNTVMPPPSRQITWRNEMKKALEEQNATGNRHIREIMELDHLPKLKSLPNVSRPTTSISNRSKTTGRTTQQVSGRSTRMSAPTYMKSTARSVPTSSRFKRSSNTRSGHREHKEYTRKNTKKLPVITENTHEIPSDNFTHNKNIEIKDGTKNNEIIIPPEDVHTVNEQANINLPTEENKVNYEPQNQIHNEIVDLKPIANQSKPSEEIEIKDIEVIESNEEEDYCDDLNLAKKTENLGFFGSFRKELGDSLINFIVSSSEPPSPPNELS